MEEWETRIQIWLKVGTVPPTYVQGAVSMHHSIHTRSFKANSWKKEIRVIRCVTGAYRELKSWLIAEQLNRFTLSGCIEKY